VKTNTAVILLATAILLVPANAQLVTVPPVDMPALKITPAPTPNSGEWHRADSTHRQAMFPQTTGDGRYWFQIPAPETHAVVLQIGNRRYSYEKGADGLWNVIVPYQGPGVKYATVFVDGAAMPEPGTNVFYSNGWKAALESPAPGEDYYAIKDVPHGDVREHWFKSSVTGTYRRMYIYTPPGYDQNRAARYPVLYLQHGAGEMEQEWTHSGRANFILDNLIAAGKAKPMIVVMNNGFASRPGEPPAGLPGVSRPALAPGQASAFEDVLIKEVIPDIDRNFRTIADRAHRALAGLSMGGGQTYTIGLRNLDIFSQLGMFSGAVGAIEGLPEQMKDAAAFNRRVPVFFLSAGTIGNDVQIHANLKKLHDLATTAGVHAIFFESPQTQHEWQTWRRSLNAFAPLIFR
jgi:enterochelin esterase-like enzyme